MTAFITHFGSFISGVMPFSFTENVLAVLLIVFAVWLAIAVYNFFEGETLISDLFDEWWLSRHSLPELDSDWAKNPVRSDVVVTLTSLPSRLPYIGSTLKSLLRQTRAPLKIIINLPKYSIRENQIYDIPEWLIGLSGVEIHRTEDLGPATKLLPTLQRFAVEQPIIVVDDDRVYHRTFIADLTLAAKELPNTTVGHSGWVVPNDLIDKPTTIWSNLMMLAPTPIRARRLKHAVKVDILQGMSGYLVQPNQFNLGEVFDYSTAPKAAWFVDDVWFAAHRNSAAYVVPGRRTNYPPKLNYKNLQKNRLGKINRGQGSFAERHNSIVILHFKDRWLRSL